MEEVFCKRVIRDFGITKKLLFYRLNTLTDTPVVIKGIWFKGVDKMEMWRDFITSDLNTIKL